MIRIGDATAAEEMTAPDWVMHRAVMRATTMAREGAPTEDIERALHVAALAAEVIARRDNDDGTSNDREH
jgi:hypothetical protein